MHDQHLNSNKIRKREMCGHIKQQTDLCPPLCSSNVLEVKTLSFEPLLSVFFVCLFFLPELVKSNFTLINDRTIIRSTIK